MHHLYAYKTCSSYAFCTQNLDTCMLCHHLLPISYKISLDLFDCSILLNIPSFSSLLPSSPPSSCLLLSCPWLTISVDPPFILFYIFLIAYNHLLLYLIHSSNISCIYDNTHVPCFYDDK